MRITKKYLRRRSGIALAIVLIAAVGGMSFALTARDKVAARSDNTAAVDMVLLSLSELALAFDELEESSDTQRGVNSRGHVRRAAHVAGAALDELSRPEALSAFSPQAQIILRQETLNPLLELEDIIFLADVATDPLNSNVDVERAAGMASDFSLRMLPVFNRLKQVELQAAEEAADRLVFYGIIALGITLFGVFVAARFVHMPMERFVIRAQSEIERNQRSAEAASEAKSMFLATMSHEIRTPLNGVLGLAEVLQDTKLDADQRRMLGMIKTSGASLLQLITDVLDLAKIEAGKMELNHQDFNLLDLCHETSGLFYGQALHKQVTLTVGATDPSAQWHVHGAESGLRQVLSNLINNAIKFTDQGSVDVRIDDLAATSALGDAGATTRAVRITVKDSGIGIAPEAIDRIFGQFEQADASTTTRFGGTGLGLSIVKQLVEAMQGRVYVRSTLGQGAEFVVEIPLMPADAKQPVETVVGPATQFNKRILVADDNRVNQMVARKLLEKLGCEVLVVNNGQEAVEQAKTFKADMILMDVRMPVMDGVEATRAIRSDVSNPSGCDLPIIGLSANTLAEHRSAAMDAGMNGYLQKPINKAALLAELNRHWHLSEGTPAKGSFCA